MTKSRLCMKKLIFRSKFKPFFFLKHPKVRPFLKFFPQSPPKVQENKV